jgi:hypothetical protein
MPLIEVSPDNLSRLDAIRNTRGMTREDAMTRAFTALEAIERNRFIILEPDEANADLTPEQADALAEEAVKVIRQNS